MKIQTEAVWARSGGAEHAPQFHATALALRQWLPAMAAAAERGATEARLTAEIQAEANGVEIQG